eukprot:TRINITY_DN5343_c0_g1_i1.p1 TRINITY_DN5343_c0_g1~~TRINITY_DN5343_c0_g1_i1.p1  ORF type:complete len:100 (+),score=3.69 TRINITY_DN5343_c0_g1_i1:309-608(+)
MPKTADKKFQSSSQVLQFGLIRRRTFCYWVTQQLFFEPVFFRHGFAFDDVDISGSGVSLVNCTRSADASETFTTLSNRFKSSAACSFSTSSFFRLWTAR